MGRHASGMRKYSLISHRSRDLSIGTEETEQRSVAGTWFTLCSRAEVWSCAVLCRIAANNARHLSHLLSCRCLTKALISALRNSKQDSSWRELSPLRCIPLISRRSYFPFLPAVPAVS